MSSIKIIYGQLKDMEKNMNYIKQEVKEKDKEMVELMEEIANSNFNASEGAKLYMAVQKFLQERRMLKTDMENYQEQFDALGGIEYLNMLEEKVLNPQPSKLRNLEYFKNFPRRHRERAKEMYHIKK